MHCNGVGKHVRYNNSGSFNFAFSLSMARRESRCPAAAQAYRWQDLQPITFGAWAQAKKVRAIICDRLRTDKLTTMSGEAPPPKIPDLSLAQSLFTLRSQPSSSPSYTAARTHLLTQIEEKSLAPLYLLIKEDLSDWSKSTYDTLKKKIDEEEERIDAKLNEAKEMNGESEVSEALIAKFTFLTAILDKVGFPLADGGPA